jgi:hypothetical protein
MDTGMVTTARHAAFAALLVAFATAACDASGFLSVGSTSVPVVEQKPLPSDRLHRQAEEALDRWAQAVQDNGGSTIVFTGPLTSQIGAWEAAVAAKDKPALAGGALVASAPLSEDRPGKREVHWTDGPKVDTQVLSAAQAFDALVADVDAPCDTCTPLEVTAANLATSLAETSNGPAEVPTWVFTIKGTAVRVTRVAVDGSVTVTPPPWNADDPPEGLSIDLAIGDAGSRTLDVEFVGAPKGADDPCGADYTAEAVESDLAVVVIVHAVGHDGAAPPGCRLVGKTRTATVSLSAPLGARVVLEGRQGLPVPVEKPA